MSPARALATERPLRNRPTQDRTAGNRIPNARPPQPAGARSQREIDALVERADLPVTMLGRFAHDPDGVGLLGGTWSGRLDKTLLVRSGRELAARLGQDLPADLVD